MKWVIADESRGGLKRVERPPHLIEVQKYVDTTTIANASFLRFSCPVDGLPTQHVSIAFPLENKDGSKSVTSVSSISDTFRVTPATPARVSVYFPAEKEVSGLRFHLHAPFVPELSRASIKDTDANDPLFEQLAILARQSLFKIRDMGLLTVDFLSILPNASDALPSRYQPICDAVTEAMNTESLTPTVSKSHRPAGELLQAKAALKDLLAPQDLRQIHDEDEPCEWAVTAPQRNSHADRFLSGLEITRWDIDQFLDLVLRRTSDQPIWMRRNFRHQLPEKCVAFDAWLVTKDSEWFQKFYAMIFRECKDDREIKRLESSRIIRLADKTLASAKKAFFPKKGTDDDPNFPSIDTSVLTTGRSNVDREAARKFLETVGVREVGQREQIEAVLSAHYRKDQKRTFVEHLEDLKRFLDLIHKEPDSIRVFLMSKTLLNSNYQWCRPSQLYLDDPFQTTGLQAFFGAIEDSETRSQLSRQYHDAGFAETVGEFATAVGVISRLKIDEVSCSDNPNVGFLVHEAPGNPSRHKIDRDYWIEGLDEAIENPSLALSELIWKTISSRGDAKWTRARYKNNQVQPIREHVSRLAAFLKEAAWVPQRGGEFVMPADADDQLLPESFEFARGWEWLKPIGFGENVAKRTEEYKKRKEVAAELGFADDESLNDAKWFAQLDADARRQFKTEYLSRTELELPEKSPTNPERRSSKVSTLAEDAPHEEKEVRSRSVSVVMPSVKKEIRPYLREQYTNSDGVMICQICQDRLPFSLPKQGPYFETHELVPNTEKLHFQNYVALCPNHGAMFKHANDSSEAIRELLESHTDFSVPVVLAGKAHKLYFTETHLADLRAVLLTEQNRADEND